MDGRRLLSVGLVAGLLVATALASLLVLETEQSDDRQQARSVADQAVAAVVSTLRLAGLSVRGANGLLGPDGDIPSARFEPFAGDVLEEGPLTLLGWAPVVPAAGRAAFERGGPAIVAPSPDGRLRPQIDAAEYLPVARIRPDVPEARAALGYDQFGEPRRADAARAARDTGRPQLTGPLVLVGSRRPAVTVYQAVYDPESPTRTAADRRRAFRGVLGGAVAIEHIDELVRAQLPDEASFGVRDGERVLITGPAAPAATRAVPALGRRWEISVTPGSASTHALPAVIGIGGTILALLAGAVVALSHRRERTLQADRDLAELLAERDALLVDVGAAVDAAGSMAGRTQALAQLLAERLGDMCLMDQVDASGDLRRVAHAAQDPDDTAKLALLPSPAQGSPQADVVRRGRPVLIADIDDDILRAASATDDEFALRKSLGVRSAMLLPLAAQGVVAGAITVAIHGADGRRYSQDDLAFGAQLAQRASLALDNARLYESEHEIATTLQQALLPPRLPAPPGLEVGVRYRPAGTGVMVGGDFYDLFLGAEGWIAVVGDVRGKGPRAAAVTALVRHTLRARASTDGIVAALGSVNAALRDEHDDELFCSLVAVEFTLDGDPPMSGRLRTVTAGHPPPIVLRADRTLEELPARGRLLGPFDDPCIDAADTTLQPGDTILLYTDGLSEARRGGEQFGEGRLHDAVRAAPRGSLTGLLTHVELEAVTFAQGRPQDDIALVALRLPLPGGATGQEWLAAGAPS